MRSWCLNHIYYKQKPLLLLLQRRKLKKLGRNRRSPFLFNKKTVNSGKNHPPGVFHFILCVACPTSAHAAKFNVLPALYWYHNLADDSNVVMTVTERGLIAVLYYICLLLPMQTAAHRCRAGLPTFGVFFFLLQPQVTSHDSARFARTETVNLTRSLPSGIWIYCEPRGQKLLCSRYIFMGKCCLRNIRRAEITRRMQKLLSQLVKYWLG